MQKATPLQRFELHNSSYTSSYLKRRTDGIAVFIKREDKNVTGSHKDRGIWSLIEHYRKRGKKRFVISSSGNAAVSAAYYCKKHGLSLDVFVGEKIPKEKLNKLYNVIATSRSEEAIFNSAFGVVASKHHNPLSPPYLKGETGVEDCFAEPRNDLSWNHLWLAFAEEMKAI